MSRSDDIWILGIHMTKFGKHPDKDVVDLGSEAIQAALADAGVTMKRHRRARRRQPDGSRRHRPAVAEAGRPDRHPGIQRLQRLRHRRHRAAHRDHGGQGRRGRLRPRGRRREAGRRRPAGGRRRERRRRRVDTAGRYGAVAPIDGRIGTETMPACSPRSAWSTGTSTAAPRSSCSPRSARRTTATRRSTRSPPTARRCRSSRS